MPRNKCNFVLSKKWQRLTTVHWNQFVSSLNCKCDVNVAWNFREDTVAAGPTCVVAFSLFYFKPQLWTFQVIHASLTIAIFIHVTKQTKSTSLNYDFQHCENDFRRCMEIVCAEWSCHHFFVKWSLRERVPISRLLTVLEGPFSM